MHARVSHTEPFSGHAADICLSAGRAVECHVSDDDILIRFKLCAAGRIDDEFSAGQPFSEVIVAVSCKLQSQSFRDKRAEALSARSLTLDHEAVLIEPVRISPCNL